MESMGYKREGVQKGKEKVKQDIIKLLKSTKLGTMPPFEQMCTIFINIDKCDHHDLCRIDQIMTILHNKNCTDYQWGSLTLDCKWKVL